MGQQGMQQGALSKPAVQWWLSLNPSNNFHALSHFLVRFARGSGGKCKIPEYNSACDVQRVRATPLRALLFRSLSLFGSHMAHVFGNCAFTYPDWSSTPMPWPIPRP